MAGSLARLTFTTSYDELLDACEIVFVAVDTPPSPSGDADLSRVQRVVREVAARGGERLLVMKSTVPVGTGEFVTAELADVGAPGIGYVVQPRVPARGRRPSTTSSTPTGS